MDQHSFNAIYHIACLNHWRSVVHEQWPLLLANKRLAEAWITIGCRSDAEGAEASALLQAINDSAQRPANLQLFPVKLEDFEHTAMMRIDAMAAQYAHPILYFHGKGVSYDPPSRNMELLRGYLNQLVSEADRWVTALMQSSANACGPLLFHDMRTNATFFAGNFWIARPEYLRTLPPYQEFVRSPQFGSPPGHATWPRSPSIAPEKWFPLPSTAHP